MSSRRPRPRRAIRKPLPKSGTLALAELHGKHHAAMIRTVTGRN